MDKEKKGETEKKTKRPTALKRDIQSEKRRLINKSFKSEMRSVMRALDEALVAKDPKAIEVAFNDVQSGLDKGVKRGIFKPNKASRTKARIKAKTTKAAAK